MNLNGFFNSPSMPLEWNRGVTYILCKDFYSCNALSTVKVAGTGPSGRVKVVTTADL